ncbi:hypothetical protein D3C72_1471070 [compost metagenome]
MAGTAFHAFGHAHQQHVFHAQIGQRCLGLCQLAGATVDQQHIRQDALLLHRAAEAAVDRLAHRGVIIARLDATDVEAAVLRAHRAGSIEHHTGGHGGFAHGMADVEALHPLHRFGQPQHHPQRFAARVLRGAAVDLGGQGQLRVAAGQFQVAGALATDVPFQLHLALGRGRQCRTNQVGIRNFAVEQDLARRIEFNVVLRNKGRQYFVRAFLTVGAGEERPGAQVAAVAEGQQHHAGLRALHGHRQHVQVGRATVHVLSGLHAAQ